MAYTVRDIISLIRKRGRGDPPAATADIFVNPLASAAAFQDTKNSLVRSEQSLNSILALLEDPTALSTIATALRETTDSLTARLKSDIDEMASNYGVIRKTPAPSRGQVTVYRYQPIDTPINVQGGRILFAPLLNQEYRITESISISAMTFDTDLNAYVADIPVESVNLGANTIADVGEISQFRDAITGLDGVTNRNIVGGGRDEEDDRTFASRIKGLLASNNLGSKDGYTNLIFPLQTVKDVLVIGANDPYMFRDEGGGGAIDIYVTDLFAILVTETVAADRVEVNGSLYFYRPQRQPIINSVATITPPAGLAVIGTVKDQGAYRGSILAKDQIILDNDPTGGIIGYQINRLISDVQGYVDDPTRKILGSDVLIKEATIVLIDLTAQIHILSGFAGASVIVNVQDNVVKFINAMEIGASLEQSDVLNVMLDTPGVDRVNLPLIKFDRVSGTVQNIIGISAFEVIRPGTISVITV